MIERIDRWLRASRWNPLRAILVTALLVLVVNVVVARLDRIDSVLAEDATGFHAVADERHEINSTH